LEKEYNYFLNNKATLLQKYPNQFIVIINETVVGNYASQEEALREASGKYTLGTFLIQKVSNNQEDTTQRFFSAKVCFR
ncbi:MAG: DUF5678 domain-containing protein, partial [Candidatus Omnitrophica bacterium]|nr:DUF5678 domain-containing protein [Candidatus Omnitrophota bacterium]